MVCGVWCVAQLRSCVSNSPISFQHSRFSNYSDPPYDSILLCVSFLRPALHFLLGLLGYVDVDTYRLFRFRFHFLVIPVSGVQLVCSSRHYLCARMCASVNG